MNMSEADSLIKNKYNDNRYLQTGNSRHRQAT